MVKLYGEELKKKINEKYKEISQLEEQILSIQKEIRLLRKQCRHEYLDRRSAIDSETGVCLICRQEIIEKKG